MLLLLCLGYATNQGNIPFGYISLTFASLGSTGSSSVFLAEEVDGVGDKESGNTTIVDVQTLLKDFLNMSLSFIKIFSCEKQNLRFWDYSPKVLDFQDFQIVRWMNGILLFLCNSIICLRGVPSELLICHLTDMSF